MVSDNDVNSAVERLRRVRSTIDRYDFLLAVIPMALGGAALTGTVFSVPFEAALLGGVLVAGLAVIDGLFRYPPTGAGRDVDGRLSEDPDEDGSRRSPGPEPGVRHV